MQRGNEDAALRQLLAGFQAVKEQQAADLHGQIKTIATQKDADIEAHRKGNVDLQQQLADCQALMKKNETDAQIEVALKKAEIEVLRQQALGQITSN
ncbi:hypothetical protein N0V86_004698 [Didymella sp. IMI 355093]|nr:hypothetical protein N0V86_004698 [Didymella sp. IMI 355093]